MGLFDYVRCKHALPGIENPESILFQTKDFDDPYMLTYEITLDGRLMRELIHYEDKSDPAAEKGSIESFAGCMTPIHEGWEDLNFHGFLCFYGSLKIPSDHDRVWAVDGCWCGLKHGEDSRWVEFKAKFTDGLLQSVEAQ